MAIKHFPLACNCNRKCKFPLPENLTTMPWSSFNWEKIWKGMYFYSLKFQTIRTLHKVHPLHCVSSLLPKTSISIALLMFQHCWIQVFLSSTSLIYKTRFIYGAGHFLSGKVIYLSSPVMNISGDWSKDLEVKWNLLNSLLLEENTEHSARILYNTKDDAFAFTSQF